MKKKRFCVESITSVLLQQVATGLPVGDVCRHVGISEQTFYRRKKSYGGMLPSEARELRQLRDENATRSIRIPKARQFVTTIEQAILAAPQFVADERRHEINGCHLLGLGLA